MWARKPESSRSFISALIVAELKPKNPDFSSNFELTGSAVLTKFSIIEARSKPCLSEIISSIIHTGTLRSRVLIGNNKSNCYNSRVGKLKKLWHRLGPGLVTGASDD